MISMKCEKDVGGHGQVLGREEVRVSFWKMQYTHGNTYLKQFYAIHCTFFEPMIMLYYNMLINVFLHILSQESDSKRDT